MKTKLTFISCVNDYRTYRKNVLKSLKKFPSKHDIEIIDIDNSDNKYSAAEALNLGASRSSGNLLVFCHQDVYFLKKWVNFLADQLLKVDNNWGVLGPVGSRLSDGKREKAGHYYAERKFSFDSKNLPIEVQSLDECCLIVKSDAFRAKDLMFDERYPGFHIYGLDICLQSIHSGLKNYAIDAPIRHEGEGVRDKSFWNNVAELRIKWDEVFDDIGATYLKSTEKNPFFKD